MKKILAPSLIVLSALFFSAVLYAAERPKAVISNPSGQPSSSAPLFAQNEVKPRQYFTAAEKLYASKLYDKAARYYAAVVKLKPDFAPGWKKLAFCYNKLGRHGQAYNFFLKAHELDKSDKETADFVEYYANIMRQREKKQEKREMSDSLIRSIVPGWGQFHNNQPLKAAGFIAATALSAGLTVYFAGEEKVKYEKYLITNDNQELAYKAAQDAWTTALTWGIITGVAYAFSIIDAGMHYDSPEARMVAFEINPERAGLGLALRW